MTGDQLRDMIFERTGLKAGELVCPREKSAMTPCAARDGDLATIKKNNGPKKEPLLCVGCGYEIDLLVEIEKRKSH